MDQDRPEEVQHAGDRTEPEESTGSPAVEESPPELEWSLPAKIGFIFTGVVLPTICLLIYGSGIIGPYVSWQTGEISDYARLLLTTKPSLPFYPFLLYCMASMTCMIVQPQRYAQRFMARLGIYTGVGIAVQYFILLGLQLSEPSLLIGFVFVPMLALVLWGCAWLISWLDSDHITNFPLVIRAILGVVASLFLVCGCIPPIPLVCSTTWALIAYSMMSWRLLHRGGRGPWQFSLAQLFAFVTWLAAYFGAWRMSVMLMLTEYAKLPTTPPEGCYICTAAARGHRWFVGLQAVRADANNVYRINDQTRYLKAAEITLAATCPRMHRLTRAVYDRVGPVAARLLVHPLAADVAYLAMKPAEWAARAFFAAAMPEASRLARRLYRGP